jgi:hypothetical protein
MQAQFYPPKELAEFIVTLRETVNDFSVPMEKISRVMLEDTREVFNSGLGEWPTMKQATIDRWGPHKLLNLGGKTGQGGSGTPLREWNQRAWSKANAAVLNRAPHAHLMEGGVRKHDTHGPSKATSKAAKKKAALATGPLHSPPRDFLFVQESSYPTFENYLLDYLAEKLEG